jgi:L-alanine-DL-glutamate epimerase-like enolase superfamily enzyme
MKTLDLKLFVVELPFHFSFNHNLAKRSRSNNLIVKAIIEHDGVIFEGYGEGIPRQYVTGETVAQAINLLEKQYFGNFKGKEFSSSAELLIYLCNQFQFFGLDERPSGASWCALELALLDAACRAEKISVGKLISPDGEEPLPSIKYGATASLTNKKVLPILLTLFKIYGFDTVKLKLGKDLDDAKERIQLARKIMGPSAILRVDANCAWTVSQTINFSRSIEDYNVSSIEQPLQADNIQGITELASTIPQAIVLDESLCTIKQAQYFAENGIKVDFNIRISKMGGLLAANTIKNIAKEAGIKSHLGAQVGESGILTTAGRIFALSKGPFVNYEGSANSLLLKYDLTKENLTFGYGGNGKLPHGFFAPGLGVTIDQNKLSNSIQNHSHIKDKSHSVGDVTEINDLLEIGSKR